MTVNPVSGKIISKLMQFAGYAKNKIQFCKADGKNMLLFVLPAVNQQVGSL